VIHQVIIDVPKRISPEQARESQEVEAKAEMGRQ
jgi:hypothetical protein